MEKITDVLTELRTSTPAGPTKGPVSFRIRIDLVKRLREAATKHQVTINSVVEMSLERGLQLLENA